MAFERSKASLVGKLNLAMTLMWFGASTTKLPILVEVYLPLVPPIKDQFILNLFVCSAKNPNEHFAYLPALASAFSQ